MHFTLDIFILWFLINYYYFITLSGETKDSDSNYKNQLE